MATLMDQIMGRTDPLNTKIDPREFLRFGVPKEFRAEDDPMAALSQGINYNWGDPRNLVHALSARKQFRQQFNNPREDIPPRTPTPAAPPAARLPQLPIMLQPGMPRGVSMPSAMPVPPPGVMGMAPMGGFTPTAPPPMNITPPLPAPRPAAPASGFVPPANVPLPPPRPADMSVRESFMQRLLGNPTQSNSMPVLPSGAALPQQVNWGDPDNPADFFRASQGLQGLLG